MSMVSVTKILSIFSNFGNIPPEVLARAAARGTEVHAACASIAMGFWSPFYTGYTVGPYLSSFKRWFDSTVSEVVACELEVINHGLQYCGHPDLLCRFRGSDALVLVDLKTPITLSPTWSLQLAAYREACIVSGYDVRVTGSLRLHPQGGNAKWTQFDDHGRAFAAFCGALSAYKYLRGE